MQHWLDALDQLDKIAPESIDEIEPFIIEDGAFNLISSGYLAEGANLLEHALTNEEREDATHLVLLVLLLRHVLGDWAGMEWLLRSPQAEIVPDYRFEHEDLLTLTLPLVIAKECEEVEGGAPAEAARCYRALAREFPDFPLRERIVERAANLFESTGWLNKARRLRTALSEIHQ